MSGGKPIDTVPSVDGQGMFDGERHSMIGKMVTIGAAVALAAGCSAGHSSRADTLQDRLKPFVGKWSGTFVCDKKPGAFTLDLTMDGDNLAGELVFTPDKVISPKAQHTGRARLKGGFDRADRLWIDTHGDRIFQLVAPQDKIAKAAAVGMVKGDNGVICGTFAIERD